MSQSFGVGLWEEFREADLGAIEEFFFSHGSGATHEICPMAQRELWGWLKARGYEAIEHSNVMYLPMTEWVEGAVTDPADVTVRLVGAAEAELWQRTACAGWSEMVGFEEEMKSLVRIMTQRDDALLLLAEIDGIAAGTAAFSVRDGVAEMAGASTVPEWRKRGAQTALILARLRAARESGCDLVAIAAEPGSASQQNAERFGFRVAYTRTKWFRPVG